MGQAVHNFPISLLQASYKHLEEIILDRKQLLLSLLPMNSELTQTQTNMNCNSTVLDCSIAIAHPLFPDGSKVEIDTSRVCWRNENGSIPVSVDELVTAVRYIGPDGKSLVPFP
jgi:hypothetical protein